MIPPFDVEGGAALALSRAASVAGLVAAAGSLTYAAILRPAGLPMDVTQRLRRLCAWSLATALLGASIWLVTQTDDLALSVSPGAVADVLGHSWFGHLLAARAALLALACIVLVLRRNVAAACLACLALLLQAGHSHALAMGGPPLLLASTALHVLAAGIWLGSLPALWLVIGAAPPDAARVAASRFSAAGLVCVGTLIVTATFQACRLVMTVPGLIGTAYGWVVMAKIALFASLVALAARNRQRLTPRLPAPPARRALTRAIGLEVALGLAVFSASSVLTELQPAMHTQALWPFPIILSLNAVREDSDILREVLLAGAALVLSLVVLVGAVWLGRRAPRRALAAAAAAACLTCAASLPHLSPLLVPAVPTLFYRSPTGMMAAAIVQGAALYPAQCAACHGAGGHGDGPLAGTLAVSPADLTAPHLWAHSDGELFWWLTHGIDGPRGGLVMPGFPALSDDDRWALIDFVRARNAGLTLGAAGHWATQLHAPDFSLTCPGGTRRLSDLRGGIVRLALAPVVTATLGMNRDGQCRAEDATVAAAYAIAAPGARTVLIDANGWLRAASRDQTAPDPMLAAQPLPRDRPATDMSMDMKM